MSSAYIIACIVISIALLVFLTIKVKLVDCKIKLDT